MCLVVNNTDTALITNEMFTFVYKVEQLEAGTPGRLKVTAKSSETAEIFEGEFNTVSCESCLCPF